MALQVIIRGKSTYGKTRAEQEANLRKDGLHGLSDEHLDKLRHAERKMGLKTGFLRAVDVDKIGTKSSR